MDIKKKRRDKIILDGDADKPIPDAYSVLDNDLARDNLENDLSAADAQDL
jgi:hypothetical protein